ncbi:MAG: hypothetical protein M3Y26_09335 [Actinomycetota bacterium]|nr:hypothetical protein [Actinomycetota bacterium]
MTHHAIREIPEALLIRKPSPREEAHRALRLAGWLLEQGVRATEIDLDQERRRRTTERTTS